jgi:hypothetical protein
MEGADKQCACLLTEPLVVSASGIPAPTVISTSGPRGHRAQPKTKKQFGIDAAHRR